ncbi:roquin-2 isoform X2 [Gadus morhua]|uniref:roquin-2 isoform X2 n=1 Tax=Gadus morhua TaxID=8049 RepID=UPI0011B72E10|nr:roquin-2 isoform X2 [Gadus morhua]
MPVQAAQWTEFLSCPVCYNEFDGSGHQPISLGCSHTVCKTCLHKLHRKACPFDQTPISTELHLLPLNHALLQLVGAQVPDVQPVCLSSAEEAEHYEVCRMCVEELALYLKPISGAKGSAALSPSLLSRPMQRKLVTMVNCQLVEEEGRVRVVRAGRSLGERTVTELILQHQNPQQLSANLWAAVRARGCQFLGPAMQEDALKLVLLALEDGSALSRKVLVLFVVQKLEARFPQASKTSIGHVVQLLYRASCFKVTKRDEDSSLMQLKEEFRSYEALRREHDAQIVHIAMEAGLRISPEQWSSLLYGDLVHKSHMQSIIDKLQSPESFAKSVQELTIVLQRTGDPANLNSLRAPLELLANIDHNPDAPAPSWEDLESVMLAVKLVIQGLVEFIQNFSKKNHESPQPQANSKYKTSMCRDLRQQGGCPRGTSCTFAHTQDELEKFRLRNKKISSAGRPFPLSQGIMGKTVTSGEGEELSAGEGQAYQRTLEKAGPAASETVPTAMCQAHLLLKSSSGTEEIMRGTVNGAGGDSAGLSGSSRSSAGSMEQALASPPRTPVRNPSPSSSMATVGHQECGASMPKQGHFLLRATQPSQTSELYYQENHPYQTSTSFYPSSLHPPHKPCLARFLRSSNVQESHLPPSPYPADPHQSSTSSSSSSPSSSSSSSAYAAPPSRDRLGPPAYHAHPHPGPHHQYGPLAAGHCVYAPLYDSRRVWRPQLYHREDARSNSLPPEVLHASVYQPPLRERFNSLDSNYCSGVEHRPGLHQDYGHVPLGYEDLFRRKQEQWTHHHHHHHHHHGNTNRPSQSSPIFTVDFSSEHVENSGGPCVGCRFRAEDSLAHYSPWSCSTVRPCISPFEPDSQGPGPARPCSERSEVDSKGAGSGSVGGGDAGKRWLASLDPYRRLKEEDPIIPFGEGPIISKWGAISRAARTGYHTSAPVQATACQGSASTTPISLRDYVPHLDHSDYRWSSRGSDSSSHSSFLESEQLCVSDLAAPRRSLSGEDLPTHHQTAYSQDREQPSERPRGQTEPGRDIELELSVLDLEDSDAQPVQSQESSQDPSSLLLLQPPPPPSSCSVPLPSPEDEQARPDKVDAHLLKKMAFRMSPGGLMSEGLGVSKLMLRTRPPRRGNTGSCPPTTLGAEMLLNGS